jgi:NCS1 family nucleobase:cation symporter-1
MGIKFRPHVPRTFKSLQIEDEGHDSRWANHDVLPAPLEERNYTSKAFFGYW